MQEIRYELEKSVPWEEFQPGHREGPVGKMLHEPQPHPSGLNRKQRRARARERV